MKTGLIIERITPKEKARLRKLTIGYGNLRAAAVKASVHENTLRNILLKGSAGQEIVQKIRENLLQDTNNA